MRRRVEGVDRFNTISGGNFASYDRLGNLITVVKAPDFSYKSGMTVTEDEVHPTHPYDGGPFKLSRSKARLQPTMVRTRYASKTGDTEYRLNRILNNSSIISGAPVPFDNCSSLGPAAWNKFKPKVTTVSLGQFLAELRDAPSLFRHRLRQFKDLGKEYLNVQFGWKPFLSDLRKWYQSIIRLDHQLHKIQKKNNVWQRRSGIISETESTVPGPVGSLHNPNLIGIVENTGETKTYEKAWFSGSFRYYVPNLSNGKWGGVKSLSKLWGLEVTPALVYELLPYSWLLDWFSNVGDVIGNYSSITNDNMAAKYAFVMRYKKISVKLRCRGIASYTMLDKFRVPYTTYTYPSFFAEYIIETKSRVEASPYGFSLNWADFSPYQLSILAALGISKIK